MNTALQAERHALEAIKGCEREAAAIIDTAQQQARAITERTNRRIGQLHVHCARVTTARIDILLKEDADAADQNIQLGREQRALAATVERVAARLTGEAERDASSN